MAVLRYDPDCGYTPDGKHRYSSPLAAAVSWFAQGAKCDVWSGIEPKKQIDLIELQENTPGGSHIVALVDPLGTGYVAVIPPFSSFHPIQKVKDLTLSVLSKFGTVYEISEIDPGLYNNVKALVGPMRDFQGGDQLEVSDPKMRKRFGLDDPRTRYIRCRKQEGVMPVQYGPFITFRDKNGFPAQYVSLGINCFDRAALGAQDRVNKTIELLVQATGRGTAIRARGELDFPPCRYEKGDALAPCFSPRL